MNRIPMLMGLCVVTLLYLTSCGSKEVEKEEATTLLVTRPLLRDTSNTRDYVCQIRSIQHIELRALEKGYLQKIYVDEGQHVKQGQLMFQIMPMLYQAELQKAQAEAQFAEIEYRNTKQLADSNIVAPNELALAKAKLDKANAERALAQVHLGFTEIKAPFNGLMDRFQVRLGSLVNEGDLLTSLSDNTKMWVYYNVPEAEYLEFKQKVRQDSLIKVKLMMANNQMFQYPGVVETIEADFNNETGNIAFRSTFPNPDGLLRHGETGNIQMTVPLRGALLIPQKATFQVLDKYYVFVVDKNDRVQSRGITIRAELEDLYAIEEGLKPTDKILLEGLRKVKENDHITYKMEDPAQVMTHLKAYAE